MAIATVVNQFSPKNQLFAIFVLLRILRHHSKNALHHQQEASLVDDAPQTYHGGINTNYSIVSAVAYDDSSWFQTERSPYKGYRWYSPSSSRSYAIRIRFIDGFINLLESLKTDFFWRQYYGCCQSDKI